MFVHGYTDDEYDVVDNNVTLISRLDVSSPLHLHPNGSTALNVVLIHEIDDVYLTAKELHQLHLDEEALRETLEEQTMDEKTREEKIRQKQADDDEYFMEFGVMRIYSDYESSD
ncbi:hypothetical protein Tco_0637460 [Tanacetum coccineum]